jgi:organic hydroperoxide reductase OsmC/OhrA
MTSVSFTQFETRLQWQGEQGAVLSSERAQPVPLCGSPGGAREEQWNPETLLVGAVEGRTLSIFLEMARDAGVEVLFYQSSAVGRRVDALDAEPHFTDLIVRPHVAVASEAEAEKVRRIFEELPSRCFPSSMLRLTPRIEPIVEAWNEDLQRDHATPPVSTGSAGSTLS